MNQLQIKSGIKNCWANVKSELRTKHSDFKDIVIKCGILFVCLFLSTIHVSFVYVTLALAAVFILFEKSARRVYYMIFLLPFLNILRRSSEDLYYSIALWCLVLLMLGIQLFIDVFIKKEKKLNWFFTIVTAALLLYITIIGPFSFTTHGAAYLTIVICYCLYYYIKDFDLKEVVFIFFLGASLACVTGFFRPLFARAQEIIPSFSDYGGRFTGVSNDPNYYAGDLLMILAGFMILYDRKQVKYLFYIAMFVLTIFAIMSLSKMMLLIYGLIMATFCIIIFFKNRWKAGFIKCLSFVFCFILCCGVCYKQLLALGGRITTDDSNVKQEVIIPSENPSEENDGEYIVYEFRNNPFTVITTGRTNIWLAYFEESFSSVKFALLGHGVGADFILCDNGYKIAHFAEHNTFVQMIYRLGIVGIGLLALMIFAATRKKSLKGINIANFMVAIVVLGLFMALCNLLSYRLSIYILVLILSLIYRGEEEEKILEFKENIPTSKLKNNKEDKFLSVIIPVKNGEKYIEKCVNSISQNAGLDDKTLEIIVVNDHSTDGTEEQVEKLGKVIKNIKLINSLGNGVSEARNTGISAASGKYIVFFDADDYVDENFKKAVETIKKENVDMFLFEFVYNADGQTKKMVNYSDDINGKVLTHGQKGFTTLCKQYNNGPVNKILNRDFVIKNNLQFKKYAVAEDMEWGVRAILAASSVFVSKLSFYHYIKYTTSAMNTASLSKTLDAINACRESILVIDNFSGVMAEKNALKRFVTNTEYSSMQYYKKLSKEDKKKFKKEISNYQEWLGTPAKPKFLLIKAFLLVFGLDVTLLLLSKI